MQGSVDEMVGLGVLRSDDHGRYMLRSPNVTLLMGSDDEIERALLEPNELPPEYEPTTFRSGYRGDRQDHRRNPLTAHQISELQARRNGVSIICGCEAGGLADIDEFLKADPANHGYFQPLDQASDAREFAHALNSTADKRKDEGTTLVLVPPSCPWTPKWIEQALEQNKRLTSRHSFLRVIFVATCEDVWRLLNDSYDLLQPADNVEVQTLEPWSDVALRHWLDDCGVTGATGRKRQEIGTITGNWPFLLYDFDQKLGAARDWRATLTPLKAEMEQPQNATTLLTKFGLIRMQIRNSLDVLRQLPDALEDVVGASELASVSEADFERAVQWAQILGLARPEPDGGLRLDQVVSRLLAACATSEN